MQQKSERVTMVKKSDCHSKIVTVDRYVQDYIETQTSIK